MIVSNGNALTIAFEKVADDYGAFAFDFRAHYTVLDNGKLTVIQRLQ